MIIKGLNFVCTCSGCPEQYDVFDSNDNQVGYVRLRWGGLTCEYPYCGEELIYEADIGNGWTGSFEDEEQRSFHLCAIADKILSRICTVNINDETKLCNCLTTYDKYDYWGYWRVCECGFNNVEEAQYCGGCGKKINVIGITKNDIKW